MCGLEGERKRLVKHDSHAASSWQPAAFKNMLSQCRVHASRYIKVKWPVVRSDWRLLRHTTLVTDGGRSLEMLCRCGQRTWPKSAIFRTPSSVTSKLAGLMSRCSMPAAAVRLCWCQKMSSPSRCSRRLVRQSCRPVRSAACMRWHRRPACSPHALQISICARSDRTARSESRLLDARILSAYARIPMFDPLL